MKRKRIIVRLADAPNYANAINTGLNLITGREKFNPGIDTSKIQLPSVKVEPTEKTMKVVKTATYVIGGSLTLLALSILIKNN